MDNYPGSGYKRLMELGMRIFDISASMIAILVLWPLLLAVMCAIRLEDGGPVFFIQERAGFHGITFKIFKFRSMVTDAEQKGTGLFVDGENDPRITRTGRILRRTSLDELPQLINILKGEMSIVGPRPGLPSHIEEYTRKQMRRLEVKPGLTGWAQINGRNSLTWPERIELDIWYIDRRSMRLNMVIILGTIPALLGGGHYARASNFSFDDSGDTGEKLPADNTAEDVYHEAVSSR
ncbi:MAG: sugar transferase [Bacteroidales bacterium]|nr:sugar transferase [Candidatus Latescibacterota bacterium]